MEEFDDAVRVIAKASEVYPGEDASVSGISDGYAALRSGVALALAKGTGYDHGKYF